MNERSKEIFLFHKFIPLSIYLPLFCSDVGERKEENMNYEIWIKITEKRNELGNREGKLKVIKERKRGGGLKEEK